MQKSEPRQRNSLISMKPKVRSKLAGSKRYGPSDEAEPYQDDADYKDVQPLNVTELVNRMSLPTF